MAHPLSNTGGNTGPTSRDAHPSLALTALRVGETAVILSANVDPADAAYLRAMGLRPHATVRVCRLGEPCIVEILACGMQMCGQCGCRIGLSRAIADRVAVLRSAAP
jgi:Fe2+ transport system protein FeoA